MSAPPANGPIRVLVADDHRVVRAGLRTFLATTEDIRVVGEASDGSQTLTQLHALHKSGEAPDVVLMDLLMSPMDGIEAANKDIAAELSISERTARTHVSSILTKLRLTSRTQAALWAVREGLGPAAQ